MKRASQSSGGSGSSRPAKKSREKESEYTATPSVRDKNGDIVWPAPLEQIEQARDIILTCAAEKKRTLIVPDKDADGLTSGLILYKTLELLGLPTEMISTHFLQKGETVHSDSTRAAMALEQPAYIFVLDQGSRPSPPLIDPPHTGLVIDHHFANAHDFPTNASFVTACHSPPVATSSLLTYEICKPLHDSVADQCAWLCAVGTHGDLGGTLKWEPPFPDMSATLKQHTKKAINDAVSLLNAPRRTATFDVRTAWAALVSCTTGPKDLLSSPRLLAARREIADEVERCTHTAPKFSADASVAVFRIHSAAQVHPLIATRWANHLSSKKLEIVLVANTGYLPDRVNFSCRIARVARGREPPVDIIARLKEAAGMHESGTLVERMGEDFARGHVQASGGIVPVQEFEELMSVLRVGEKPDNKAGDEQDKALTPNKKSKVEQGGTPQKNTLMNYFGKKDAG